MANSLQRDIEPGEVLVLRKSMVSTPFQDVRRRLFVARSGFGLKAETSGGAILGDECSFTNGRYVLEGRGRWNGGDFSKSETEQWQTEYDKFFEPDATPVGK